MISLLVALDQYHCRYAAATMAVLLFLPKPMAESGLTIAVAVVVVVVVDDLHHHCCCCFRRFYYYC